MEHRARVYVRRRAPLRVGLASEVAGAAQGTGHGNVWSNVLAELRRRPDVKLVRRRRADVWLASGHELPPDGRPLVVQVHEAGWRDQQLRSFLNPAFAEGIDSRTGKSLSVAARVITPSTAAARQVIDAYGYPAASIHPVHHGVDHRVFMPGLTGGRDRVGAPYVLFVAVLHPRKNFEAVRQSVARLADDGLPHALAIVGNPAADPDAGRFERAATAELPGHPGRIVHFRDLPGADLAALMAGADAFCLPSWFEGFGLPTLEAMACGTPVVVSDRGALPEVVGDAGLIVSPSPEAVSEALARVLTEPERAQGMRQASVERAAQFSWEKTAAGWLSALEAAA